MDVKAPIMQECILLQAGVCTVFSLKFSLYYFRSQYSYLLSWFPGHDLFGYTWPRAYHL